MKIKFGTLLMVLGSVLLAAALALFLFNRHQQQQASRSVEELMPQMAEIIQERKASPAPAPQQPEQTAEPEEPQMTVVEIDGHGYIGFVGIPALELELPVLAQWSDALLKISPCLFTGSVYSGDMVIMAHNYTKHFGRLYQLRAGDTVTFTDMDGITRYYEVAALDVLGPYDVEEMTAGEYALTLFTCTYGGENRVTVRCDIAAD